MKPGYSLLELMIGIFLASMLAITLFQSVRNTTTTVELADDIMDLDMRVAIFHHQFARDTIGIFLPEQSPEQAPAPEATKQPLKPGEKAPLPSKDEKPETAQKPSSVAQAPADGARLPDKLFYSVNEQGQISEFTFITANPMSVYEKATNVTVKPRMVRVMYRLLPDEQHENSFTLYRQEVDNLDVSAVDKKAATPVRMYPLMHNIKKMTLDFSFPEKREAKEEAGKPGASGPAAGPGKPPAPETPKKTGGEPEVEKITTLHDWPFKTAEEAQEKKAPLYPQIITAKFELWDTAHLTERAFTLLYPIASFTLFEKKKKKPKKAAPPKPAPDKTAEKIDLSLILTPKTEERLTQLGEQVFKLTLESKVQTPNTTRTTVKDFIIKQEELFKIPKSAL